MAAAEPPESEREMSDELRKRIFEAGDVSVRSVRAGSVSRELVVRFLTFSGTVFISGTITPLDMQSIVERAVDRVIDDIREKHTFTETLLNLTTPEVTNSPANPGTPSDPNVSA